MSFHVPENNRVRHGCIGTDKSYGNNGAFELELRHGQQMYAIASDSEGWEHVSVSRTDRCPTWDEMCQVKAMFWDEDDCVIQYHPAKSEYVNNHPYCLHLWRPIYAVLPTPPVWMVGIKDAA